MTDYPGSLAAWANTTDAARLSEDEAVSTGYWQAIRQAIRQAERLSDPDPDNATPRAPLPTCNAPARYGTSPDMVRMGRAYRAEELVSTVPGLFSTPPNETTAATSTGDGGGGGGGSGGEV